MSVLQGSGFHATIMMQKFTLLFLICVLARVTHAKSVFAHFMAQNSYSYAESDWTNDMTTAQNIGIDGFGTPSLYLSFNLSIMHARPMLSIEYCRK